MSHILEAIATKVIVIHRETINSDLSRPDSIPNRPARCLAIDRAFRTWLCPQTERMAWRGISAPYISNFGIIWGLVPSLTPQPLYLR